MQGKPTPYVGHCVLDLNDDDVLEGGRGFIPESLAALFLKRVVFTQPGKEWMTQINFRPRSTSLLCGGDTYFGFTL